MTTCVRCQASIQTQGGYAVYRAVKMTVSEPGYMDFEADRNVYFLCERCANTVFTETAWAAARMQKQGVEDQAQVKQSYGDGDEQTREFDFRVIDDFQGRGLGPIEAREKARNTALQLWRNQSSLEELLQPQIQDRHSFTPLRGKRWWEFWK